MTTRLGPSSGNVNFAGVVGFISSSRIRIRLRIRWGMVSVYLGVLLMGAVIGAYTVLMTR